MRVSAPLGAGSPHAAIQRRWRGSMAMRRYPPISELLYENKADYRADCRTGY